MGSPAASAEVQPSGRSAFERRSKIAPDPADQPDAPFDAAYSSQSLHAPMSSIRRWRSPGAPLPSIFGDAGMG
jgi:hypothetical protein